MTELTEKQENDPIALEYYHEIQDKHILDFTQNPDGLTPYRVARGLVMTQCSILGEWKGLDLCQKVIKAAETTLKMKSDEIEKQIIKVRKEFQEEKDAHDRTEKVKTVLGGVPTNEREYVKLLIDKRYKYSRNFTDASGEVLKAHSILNDLLLTAADLDFLRPRGHLLSDKHIKTAFDAWIDIANQERKKAVWKRISVLSDGRTRQGVMDAFRNVCEIYFTEPEFAMAACLKGIWQVKRKMQGLPIMHYHMIVIQSREQNSGKTTFLRMMLKSGTLEVFSEADTLSVLDDKNFDLRENYVVFVDELAKAERACVNKLKNVITGEDVSTRRNYTHSNETVHINMTLFGTSNPELSTIIYDTTGMRRFIEVHPKERKDIEQRWNEIENFDWIGLWQAVDENAPDPIMDNFSDVLLGKQEIMRAKDNVESWLEQFEPATKHSAKVWVPYEYAEYFASDLYSFFRIYEEQYHPASHGTSITRWGMDLKNLIKNGKADGWSFHDHRNRTIYHVPLSNVLALDDAEDADTRKTRLSRLAQGRTNVDF